MSKRSAFALFSPGMTMAGHWFLIEVLCARRSDEYDWMQIGADGMGPMGECVEGISWQCDQWWKVINGTGF